MGLILPKISRRNLLKAGAGLFVPCAPAIIRPARAALTVNNLTGFSVVPPAAEGPTGIEFVGSAVIDSKATTDYFIPLTGLTGGSDTQARTGDVILVFYGLTAGGDATLSVDDTTLTWTETNESWYNDTYDLNIAHAWAYADVAPPASVAIGHNSLTSAAGKFGIAYVFRGVDPTTPMDETPVAIGALSSTTANPFSITPATDGAAVVAFGAASQGATDWEFTAAPSGYDGFVSVNNAGTAPSTWRNLAAAAHKLNMSAGVSENPGAFTASNTNADSAWGTYTIALRPAA